MIKLTLLIWVILVSTFIWSCSASNILSFMPMCAKSHKISADPLLEELAKRGHKVTEISLFKTSRPHPNIRTILLHKMRKHFESIVESAANLTTAGIMQMITFLGPYITDSGKVLMEDDVFKNFTGSSGPFDVVITSTLMNDIALALIPIYFPGIPLVLVSANILQPDTAWSLNIPFPISYVPLMLTTHSSEMTFLQRVGNTVAFVCYNLYMSCIVGPTSQRAVQSYIPDVILPNPRDVEGNASLLLTNSHFTFSGSKPSMPFAVEVGGMHCRAAEKLPKEFSDFIEGAGEHGFIVFSLGSVVQAKHMPKEIIDSFKAAFKEIDPVRVFWKYEEKLEGVSSNVMISKWMPQQDLIGHPKCRLAITHGGLMSLQEAIYHGVPVLGIPLGADRDSNLLLATNKGIAKSLEWQKLTPEIALDAIKSMIFKHDYKEKAEAFGRLNRDRPQQPVELAAYWVEYVIRHKGAAHLKPTVNHLNIFQYFIIDVVAFVVVIVFTAISFLYLIIKSCFKCIFRRNSKSKRD
ncbi:hypothetical protein CHUAL_013257 [Chamberlinius hualienensis]